MYKLLIHLRSKVLVLLTHNMALPFLRLIRKPEIFPYTLEALSNFEQDSLGRSLADFLDGKQLQLLPYYAKHDLKHILLEYDTTDEGEVCLQCFMLGNRHISFPVAATVLYGLFTMPEHWLKFRAAFRRGRKAGNFKDWKWFAILHLPVVFLRSKIDVPACISD